MQFLLNSDPRLHVQDSKDLEDEFSTPLNSPLELQGRHPKRIGCFYASPFSFTGGADMDPYNVLTS